MSVEQFTDEQKGYLEGFASGSGLARSLSLAVLPTFAATLGVAPGPKPRETEGHPVGADGAGRLAQDRVLASGKKLSLEEQAKRKLNGLETWDLVMQHARDGRYPKGTDVFMIKFQGLFYVAPAQDSFMCRMRFPAGILSSHQLRGVATIAEQHGGGYADVTTRANLQIREIGARGTIDTLMALADLGIIIRGSGADNIRNVTANATAGIDPRELIDVRPLAKEMHYYILNHPEMYGLPRKFNIAFDGGGLISALEDTNDIGFVAVTVGEGEAVPAGVYFRMQLGGITGHKDFARDSGVLLKPQECVPVAAAVVRAFIEHGDRTDRKKARLKYVLDRMGHPQFLEESERHLGRKLTRFPAEKCQRPPTQSGHGHIGIYPQKQSGLRYVGVHLPVGRMKARQMRGLADIADRYGSGSIRLTVWQNLLLSDIPVDQVDKVQREIEVLGLKTSATGVRGGLVACTGNAGCKFAAANTKAHALQTADYLESSIELDRPVNIHFTGCHNSCAQHFIGDIGLIGTKVAVGDDMIEGYHIFVGGGYGDRQEIGRQAFKDVVAADCGPTIERMLRAWLDRRESPNESFQSFVARHSLEALSDVFANIAIAAPAQPT